MISPDPLMSSFRWATAELLKSCGLYQGRIVAATVLPRNVTAMTSVASRVQARTSAEYEYATLRTTAGIMM